MKYENPDDILKAIDSLRHAISTRDRDLFKRILDKNDTASFSKALDEHHILHAAIYNYQLAMVKILLNREHKPDIHALDENGTTPFMLSFRSNLYKPSPETYETMELLLEAGANTELRDPIKQPTWQLPIMLNYIKTVQLLLTHGIDVNYIDRHGSTAIITAACHSSAEMVDLLIKFKADVNLVGHAEPHLNSLATIIRREFSANPSEKIKIIKLLLTAGAKIDSAAIKLCREDDNLLNILAGGDIDTEDSEKISPRKQIFDKIIKQISGPISEQKALEIAKNKLDAGHFNLSMILLKSIADSEEKLAIIYNRVKTAAKKGEYIEWDSMHEMLKTFDPKLHDDNKATTVVMTVKDNHIKPIKIPSKEKIFKEDLEKITLERFFNKELPQHELNSEEYCKTIYEKDQAVLETPKDKAFFTAFMADQRSASHLETVLLAKVSFDYLNPAMDEVPPGTDEPPEAQAPADVSFDYLNPAMDEVPPGTGEPHSIELPGVPGLAESTAPPAAEDNVAPGLIACTPEY